MSVEDRYYKINRILLKIIGLWPYQNRKLTRVYGIFTIFMYLSVIFVQLAVFITHELTLNIVIEVLSFSLLSIFMFFMYDMFYFNSDKVKEITEYIYRDWKFFKNKAELSILDDYASLSRLSAVIFALWLCIGVTVSFALIIFDAVPITLDVASFLNDSRALELRIMTEYFLDQSKYYHLIAIHLITFACLGAITVVATGSSLLSYGFHACATLKVTNCRMKITIDKHVLQLPRSEMEHTIHRRIVCAVDAHRRSIQFINLLLCSFEKSFLFMIIIGVTTLSINLFRLLKALIAFQIMEMSITIVVVCGQFCYLFMGNHIGQLITNNNAEIFDTVYSLPWYLTSINIQKLLIFLLQKGQKDMYLTAGGLFDASYEGFTTLVTSSISYFTVIYTIQ